MSQTISQIKGDVSFIYGALPVTNLVKEASITYDIGQRGTTVGALKDVIHIVESSGSIVSTVTITVPKNAPEVAILNGILLANTPLPLLIRDDGLNMTVGMSSANCSQIALSDTTGDSTVETISYSFMGNLSLASI